jgi:uncharacterized membrane protein YeaQ/YmgE (transglycosylase-associated protein family)
MNLSSLFSNHWIRVWTPLTAIIAACLIGALPVRAADSVSAQVGAVTSEAQKEVQNASHAAETKAQELWRRIDEQRLKHRTPDQIVAWVIMGLLVGGLIHQFSKLNKVATFLLGLAGAFVGGIIANVAQLDLGLGPVLIRYEELLASLVGGLLIVFAARLLASRRPEKK